MKGHLQAMEIDITAIYPITHEMTKGLFLLSGVSVDYHIYISDIRHEGNISLECNEEITLEEIKSQIKKKLHAE